MWPVQDLNAAVVLTGGTQWCDWYQEPRRYHSSREEASTTGSRSVSFLSWPLPVRHNKTSDTVKHIFVSIVFCLLMSVSHCRADLFEDNEIQGLLKFRPWWTKLSPSTEQEGEAGEFKMSLKFNHAIYRTLNMKCLAQCWSWLCYKNNVSTFLFHKKKKIKVSLSETVVENVT